MNLVKMQLACLSVLVFIAANYFFENHQHKISFKGKLSFAELKRLRNHMTNFQQILRLGFLYIGQNSSFSNIRNFEENSFLISCAL